MLGLFEKEHKTSIGLDVGHSSIKFVKIKKSGKGYVVISYGVANINKKTKLHETLHSLFKEEGYNNPVFTCVSGSRVYIQNFTLSYLPENKLEDTVKLASQKYISEDISKTNFTFREIGEIEERKLIKKKVLILAADKEFIDNKINILLDAGLKVEGITAEPFAYWNLMQFIKPELSNYAIIDIGKESTKISTFQDSVLNFTREIITSGHSIIESIENIESIPFDEAFDLIMKYGLYKENKKEVLHTITPIIDRLISEIERTFSYYKQKNPELTIEKIYLTGNISMMPGLQSYLNKRIGYDTELLNPFENPDISFSMKDSTKLKEYGPIYALAFGLAMHAKERMDILPVELKQKKLMTRLTPFFILTGLILISIMTLLSFRIQKKYSNALSVLNSLKSKQKNINHAFLSTEQIQKRIEKHKIARETFNKLEDRKKFDLGVIKDITDMLPNYIMLENISFGDIDFGRKTRKGLPLRISGFAFGDEIDLELGLYKFTKALESKNSFLNIIVSNKIKAKIGNRKVLKFTITCDIDN